MVEKMSDPEWSCFLFHLNTGQPNHLISRQMDPILISYVLVQCSNGWSSIVQTDLLIRKEISYFWKSLFFFFNNRRTEVNKKTCKPYPLAALSLNDLLYLWSVDLNIRLVTSCKSWNYSIYIFLSKKPK